MPHTHTHQGERTRRPVTAKFYELDEIDDYAEDPFASDEDEYLEWLEECEARECGMSLPAEAPEYDEYPFGHYESEHCDEVAA